MSNMSELHAQPDDGGMMECLAQEEMAYKQCIQDAAGFVRSGAVSEDQLIADLERVLRGNDNVGH